MRILVIEDHRDIAENIGDYLAPKGHEVDYAADGITGLHLAVTNDYDVIVLDLTLPGLDGLEVCRKVRDEARKTTPILMLTARDQLEQKIEGFQAGADDYLVKPFAFSELLARVQALIRRSSPPALPTHLEVGDLRLDLLSRDILRDEQKIDLQPREFALLEYLMRNPGRVLSKTMILEHVWDYSFDPQTNVVDVLVCRLRNKVDRDFEKKMIHTIRGVGYVLKSS